jgi:hypothetical protein
MKYSGPADISTPCDECGGPTYTFASGSIWCPDEDAHTGGHFVKRVAFEASPAKTGVLPLAYPKREPMGPRVRKVAEIAAKVERERKSKSKPVFNNGYDAFVESK